MNSMLQLWSNQSYPPPSSSNSLALAAALGLIYLTVVACSRLYFSPAARFPGPKLAALTFWYEFYYDVWLEGQYTWKIRELHSEYGPFVRINPYEVHCDDPDFFDKLYVTAAQRRTDKSMWLVRQSWTRNSTFKTIEHDLHRQRRSQLSPFFSKTSIRKLESRIVAKVEALCHRLELSTSMVDEKLNVVSLTHAHVAFTLDVISHVCFGISYNLLSEPDFARVWHDDMSAQSRKGHLVRQFPRMFHALSWIGMLLPVPKATKAAVLSSTERRETLTQQVSAVVDAHSRGEKPSLDDDGFTIFHSILDSDAPSYEKSTLRLVEEAQALIGAGSLTTANALDFTIYYLLFNPRYLDRLQQELMIAIPDQAIIPSVAVLEGLPFLAAVVHEGLRLSKGVPHRFSRVSPDVDYRYGEVVIPRGVPVGMSYIDMVENCDAFPDPNAFKPERWLPLHSPEVRLRRKMIGRIFGGGTRICLGINMAWAELYLIVATVIRRFGHRLVLFDMDFERDLKVTVDGFNALPSRDSRGLRVIVHQPVED